MVAKVDKPQSGRKDPVQLLLRNLMNSDSGQPSYLDKAQEVESKDLAGGNRNAVAWADS
jgi:hypothetical protein